MPVLSILFILSQHEALSDATFTGHVFSGYTTSDKVGLHLRMVPLPVPSILSKEMEHEQLTETIIGCAMRVHRTLGPGFLESVYQKALAHELRKAGLRVECERPIQVAYDGEVVGDFAADMLVEGVVMVENKAVQALAPAHEVQLVNYLTATGVDIGLLLNFGAEKLEFRRKHRVYRPGREGNA